MSVDDLRHRIAALPAEKRALLERRLLEAASSGRQTGKNLTIPRRDPREPCPLSFAQQRLWFLHQLEPDSPAYNISQALRLTGHLDVEVLRRAFDAIVERHEALRTTFVIQEATPFQVIAGPRSVYLPVIDVASCPEQEREAEIHRRIDAEARRPFDLSSDLMVRAALMRLGPSEHILLLTLHHVAADGWSIRLLVRELAAFYDAFAAGSVPSLPPLPIQYADYAVWQRRWLQGPVLETQLAYWRCALDGAAASLALPTDRPRAAVQTYNGARQTTLFRAPLTDRLAAIGRAAGATPFMTVLAAFQTLLSRYTGQHDVLVGSPIAGRNRVETEGLIGFFVNTLVLRTDLSGDPTFVELLRRTRDVALGAYAHQDLPFEKLVEELRPERDLSRSPIFQVLFGFQSMSPAMPTLPGLSVAALQIEPGTAKFDLSLYIDSGPDGMKASLEYNSDLFNADTIRRMLGHLGTLLEGIAADPDRRLSELPLLPEGERRQLLVEWNDTAAAYPRDAALHHLFAAQARQTPDRIAAVFEDSSLTYAELNEQADRVAWRLRSLGIGREALVGICVQRSLDMVAGLLGILKAGAAYLPLDPTHPRERLEFILADARPAALLTQQPLVRILPDAGVRIVCLDTAAETPATDGDGAPPDVDPGDLAYVIYTSGSTGRPKGVQVPHRAVVNFLTSMRETPGIVAADRLLAVTTLSFDIAALELFLPLTTGATLVITSPEVAADGLRLREQLARAGATVMQATPATWRLLIDAGWSGASGLKVLCGGEPLSRELADQLLERCSTLWNLYGPTETTVWCTVGRVHSTNGSITIGRPIANTRIYLLDRSMQPVPVGVAGEVYIAGAGVARGYLGRADLTAERFLLDPFSPASGERMYRTGDLARYLPTGELEHLGRIDDQVKVRGFRIEPAEVESALMDHPAIREAAIVARDGLTGDRSLVAYVVSGEERPPAAELRDLLAQKLPSYMVPSRFVTLERLPLSPNGKVDRRALAARPLEHHGLEAAEPARDELERQLAEIWAKVLGVSSVGIRDNFFDLGGHSLLAVRVFADIEKLTGRALPLASLFEGPTVEHLARRIRTQKAGSPSSCLVVIRRGVGKPPLFLMHPHGGHVLCYENLARHLPSDQPLYGLEAVGLRIDNPADTIEQMAARYVDEVRTVQPAGPYFLAGYCLGGVLAFEVACQLRRAGHDIALVAVFETRSVVVGRVARVARRVALEVGVIGRLRRREQLRYVTKKARNAVDKAWLRTGPIADVPLTLIPAVRRVERLHTAAVRRYRPIAYPGTLHVFAAPTSPADLGWGDLAMAGIVVHDVPANGQTIVEEPRVRLLAAKLQRCLEQAQACARG